MMFSLIEHIEYLMTRHDCVTIPGWGAFIANYGSARYDDAAAVMERPQRFIGFNAGADHNDGLLAQSLMRREGMSYDEAMRFIGNTISVFRQQLAKGGEVSMGRLGRFGLNQGRLLEFVPSSRDHSTDGFFGLADVKVMTVEALERQLAASETAASVAPRRNLFVRRVTRIAASVAVLIGLGILLTTPIAPDSGRQDMATLAPTVKAPQPQPSDVTVQQGVVAQDIAPVAENQGFGGVGNTSGKYYMVIATLRNQQELEAFKNKYPSLVPHMRLLDYKGLMCVYVARSDDYAQLMSLRGQLPERLRDVWIYN